MSYGDNSRCCFFPRGCAEDAVDCWSPGDAIGCIRLRLVWVVSAWPRSPHGVGVKRDRWSTYWLWTGAFLFLSPLAHCFFFLIFPSWSLCTDLTLYLFLNPFVMFPVLFLSLSVCPAPCPHPCPSFLLPFIFLPISLSLCPAHRPNIFLLHLSAGLLIPNFLDFSTSLTFSFYLSFSLCSSIFSLIFLFLVLSCSPSL